MSCDKLCLKWAVVYSVPDKETVSKISEYTKSFLERLICDARKIGIHFNYQSEPSLEQYVEPGNLEGCVAAYDRINKECPSAQLVIHILPKANSDEYGWMKDLARRFGIVRQGLLAENCLNNFSGNDVSEVCRNIAQWICRASHMVATSKDAKERVFDIIVGTADADSYSFCKAKLPVNHSMMQSAVSQVLHGSEKKVFGRDESAVRVEGIPATLNEFGIAQLFGELCITGVSLMPGSSAIVTFVNKFHAMQAAELDNKTLDRQHTLRVTPLAEDVLEQLKVGTVLSH